MSDTLIDAMGWNRGTAPALSDGGPWLSYHELATLVWQAAGEFRQRYGQGRFVLLAAPNRVEFVVQLLGLMASGNTPIPFNPDAPAADVAFLKQKAQAVDVLDPLAPAQPQGAAPGNWARADQPAMVLFTSGTSGFPKGVVITQAGLLHACRTVSDYLNYAAHPSAAVALPLHYSYGLLSQVCCLLLVGGRVRLFREFRNPLAFAKVVNDEQLETFCGVPSTYFALATLHGLSPLSMPSVRVLCSAGAAMDRARFDVVKQIFPRAMFFNNYGMTEAAPRISYLREDDPRFFEPTCGRPMAGVEVRVVDPQTHAALPEGEEGMLVVRGPNITPGYLHDEDLTRQAFTAEGFLISGDIARLDRGYIFITGRHDDIFNVGGEKVAPLEIERVLNQLPPVELSAVAGLRDEQRGMIAAAYLKLREPVSRKELQSALRGRLPPSKVPQRFFEVRAFPMTANAKLQRRRLSPGDAEFVLREIR